MSTKERVAVASLLRRACELGLAIDAIAGDLTLQRLSREAWVRDCLKLGSFADIEALEVARAKIRANCPYLAAEIERTALVWVRELQPDPPSHWLFAEGQGDRATAYAERLATGFSVDEASAVTAYIAAERAPPAFFGWLNDRDEPQRLTAPFLEELEQLDAALATDLRVARDVLWRDGKGTVSAGGVTLVLDQGNVGSVASALAQAARHASRGLAQAA